MLFIPKAVPYSDKCTVTKKKAVVVGGGIVGVCCALFLQNEGLQVTLIDCAEPGESTVKWSGGLLAVSDVFPLSRPSILKRIPSALIKPYGPLSIRPGAFPGILPWAMHFLANARSARITATSQAMATLTRNVYSDYEVLLKDGGNKNLIGNKPVIQVFKHASGRENYQGHAEQCHALGFQTTELSSADIADLEPVLAGKFAHGVMLNDWRAVNDTRSFMVALTNLFLQRGGERLMQKVTGLSEKSGIATGVILNGQRHLPGDHFVIAAGMGSRHFFKQLGVNIPLIGIAGYKTLLTEPGVTFNHSVIYTDGGFCFTPMTRGLQMGGMLEFAGANAKPDFRRAEIIMQQARELLPQLNPVKQETGVGYRPTLPDSKPVIDRSHRLPNVLMAFGHGSLGLTLGATTGRIVSELVAGKIPGQDIAPFSAYRFKIFGQK
ncbi:NAD(P)/FAD-dependent oxidoreductase [Brenneria corticis]|uniref:Amino acid dehydrogenase n=1 Tax=Brenneria corticis TaxID=2173106 RepID=A0A2U1U4X3_9GAMM|nr:FAD-binding oxidoreductase [Brenneria sp. CFCC 11842]PWC16705.1 amino acid dehydrogenase [Brenneria sp. CFCC 11842]